MNACIKNELIFHFVVLQLLKVSGNKINARVNDQFCIDLVLVCAAVAYTFGTNCNINKSNYKKKKKIRKKSSNLQLIFHIPNRMKRHFNFIACIIGIFS